MKKTIKIYENDTYIKEYDSIIYDIQQIDGKMALVFEETIFYPQGGGQPSDTGIIVINGTNYTVSFVSKSGEQILHFLEEESIPNDLGGKVVTQKIDFDKRITNAKYHSAGHLITNILESWNDSMLPSKGHHFPSQAYIEMDNAKEIETGGLIDTLNSNLLEEIKKNDRIQISLADFKTIKSERPELAKIIPKSEIIRTTKIGNHHFLPCGGTHVKNIGELENVTVTKIKRKKNKLKVSYRL